MCLTYLLIAKIVYVYGLIDISGSGIGQLALNSDQILEATRKDCDAK